MLLQNLFTVELRFSGRANANILVTSFVKATVGYKFGRHKDHFTAARLIELEATNSL
jgi:hypothetical protein